MVRSLTTTAILAAGLLIGAATFAQTSHPNVSGETAPGMVRKDTLSQQDKDFVKDAAAGGMAEVALSKLAEKSENPDVKHFAERMVRDHTAANAELTKIAAGLGAETPKALDTEHQRTHDQLRSMHGKAFDQQYMRVMVEDHNEAVKLFRSEAGSTGEGQLKQFAQKTLPTIEQHQKMAVDLSHRLAQTAVR